jgi:phytoene/squalene synthetase
VAGPFHALIQEAGLPLDVIDRLIEARVQDVYGVPFEDRVAFDAYLDATAGGLMWLASACVGGRDEAGARGLGWALGLANYLRAVPELEARGRHPLPDGQAEAIQDLAKDGLQRLATAKGRVPMAAALAAWQARGLLRQVMADPRVVADGAMGLSEFGRRGWLVWAAFTGRI